MFKKLYILISCSCVLKNINVSSKKKKKKKTCITSRWQPILSCQQAYGIASNVPTSAILASNNLTIVAKEQIKLSIAQPMVLHLGH